MKRFKIWIIVALILAGMPCYAAKDCALIHQEIATTLRDGPREKLSGLYKQLGDCYAANGQTAEALQAYQQALAFPFDALSIPYRLQAVRYLLEQHHNAVAAAELTKILYNDPNNREAQVLLAKLPKEQPAANKPVSPSKPVQPVAKLEKEQPVSQAKPPVTVQEKAPAPVVERVRREAHLATLYKQTGDRYAEMGKEQLALKAYNKALSYSFEALSISERLRVATYLSDIAQYDLAIAELNKILKHEPHNNEAQVLLAYDLDQKGDYAAAETAINTALAQEPQNSRAQLVSADILSHISHVYWGIVSVKITS